MTQNVPLARLPANGHIAVEARVEQGKKGRRIGTMQGATMCVGRFALKCTWSCFYSSLSKHLAPVCVAGLHKELRLGHGRSSSLALGALSVVHILPHELNL